MKKLIVKDDVCIGCGACIAIDNTHFDFDENGLSSVISQDNLDTEDVQNAINACPVNAIKIVEEENGCCCHEGCTCGENCECTSEHKCSDNCTCEN